MGARELDADARPGEPLDRLPVQALGDLAFGQQHPPAGLAPSLQALDQLLRTR
jgi:hypothetical protein